MITIYRVQDCTGRGPWRPGFSQLWIEGDADAGHLTETIFSLVSIDTLQQLPRSHVYGCGCRSLAALLDWFTPLERTRLDAFGFWPVSMTIDRVVAESARQVFFARARPLAMGARRLSWTVSA
jgi:hypothetical protein